MRNFSLWLRLGVSDETERKSDKLMAEGEKIKADGINVRKKADGMNQELFEAHERFRFAQIVEDPNLVQFHKKVMEIKYRKTAILENYQRVIEKNRIEHEEVLKPVKADADKLLDDEMRRMSERYVCALPVARPHPQNPDRELGPVRTDIESGERWLDVRTNASSVVLAKEMLAETKTLIRDVASTKELKKILDDLGDRLNELDLIPREVSIRESEYERINTAQMPEVAYLVKK